jgi:hypothetical protein
MTGRLWRKAAARHYEPFPIPVRASWKGIYWNVGFALGGMIVVPAIMCPLARFGNPMF